MREMPILDAFTHSIQSTINNIKFAFHASWPWMLALLPISIIGNIYILSFGLFDPKAPLQPQVFLTSLAMGLCSMLAFSSIAVNWHRYILKDEVPFGMQRLRMDNLVARYFGNTLMIGILSGLVAMFIFMPVGLITWLLAAGAPTLGIISGGILAIAAFLFVIGLSVRWSIKLVAVAMGRTDFGISDAKRLTEGNHLRIVGLYLLVFLMLIMGALVIAGASYGLANTGSTWTLSTLIVIQMAVNWISTIWNVTLLTSLYGYFVEGREF